MFLWLIGILTIGQMYFEFKIVKALGLEGISRRFVLVNLAISVVITIATGWLFGAAGGMVVVSAGMLSTVLSQPMYNFLDGYKKAKPKLEKVRDGYVAHREQINQTLADLAKLAVVIALVITFPFRVLRWCIRTSESLKQKYRHIRPNKEAMYT